MLTEKRRIELLSASPLGREIVASETRNDGPVGTRALTADSPRLNHRGREILAMTATGRDIVASMGPETLGTFALSWDDDETDGMFARVVADQMLDDLCEKALSPACAPTSGDAINPKVVDFLHRVAKGRYNGTMGTKGDDGDLRSRLVNELADVLPDRQYMQNSKIKAAVFKVLRALWQENPPAPVDMLAQIFGDASSA